MENIKTEHLAMNPEKAADKSGCSLAFKVILPVVSVIMITCIAFFALYSIRMEQRYLDRLQNSLDQFTATKAAELVEPLWSFQDELLESLMRSYRDTPDLFQISLYDNEDKLIISELGAKSGEYSTILTTEYPLRRVAGGEKLTLGKLVVAFHDGRVQEELATRLESDVLFSIVIMLVLVATVWLTVQKMVGVPLGRIQKSLKDNARKSARTPLAWESRDELGDVVAAYNALLHEVQEQASNQSQLNSALKSEIVQRRKAERKLAKAHAELESKVTLRTLELRQANAELVELDQQRAGFLSSASHELRTPLAAVLGFAAIVKKSFNRFFLPVAAEHQLQGKAETIVQNLDIIAAEGDRLTRLINDLLDLNKIESGYMDWRDNVMNIADVVDRSIQSMSSVLESESAPGTTVAVPDGLPLLYCDADRIQQVLLNLLSNAVKHTDGGEILVEATHKDSNIVLSVADTGKGISHEDQQYIFQKFFQCGSSDTDKPAGTGLGLPICKNIVEHYGGSIHCVSEPGVGSTFVITLPCMDDEAARSAQTSQAPQTTHIEPAPQADNVPR